MNQTPTLAYTVLVVDDDPGMRLTVAANLEDAGARVLVASSGDEALGVLSRGPVDLILSDVRMPGMSGVDLWRQAHERHPELPGVLMTGFSGERTLQRALDEGVYAVLQKPFDIDMAVAVMRRAVLRLGVLVLEASPDGPLGQALGASSLVVRTRTLGDAREHLPRVDVVVTDLTGCTWAEVEALRRDATSVVGVVVVSTDKAPAGPSSRWVQLAPPVSPAVLRRVVAELRGSA